MQQHPRALLPVTVLCALCLTPSLWSQADSSRRELVLFIGALNADGYPDTVRGVKTPSGYLPCRILWGRPAAHPAGAPQTRIFYNGSPSAEGAVSFQKVNADTLADMVIHVRSTFTDQGIACESLRSVAIFGQQALDALPVIDIGDIGRLQAEPFVAMELVRGAELAEPATRDLSGTTSYLLEPVDLVIEAQDSTAEQPVLRPGSLPLAGISDASGGSGSAVSLRIHPNPAEAAVMIEADGLRDGLYRLMLVSLDGSLLHRQDFARPRHGRLAWPLDLRRFPAGYYLVRLTDAEAAGAAAVSVSSTIVITR